MLFIFVQFEDGELYFQNKWVAFGHFQYVHVQLIITLTNLCVKFVCEVMILFVNTNVLLRYFNAEIKSYYDYSVLFTLSTANDRI